MSVKLSELLEAGAAALYAAGEAAEDLELFDFVKPYKDKACAVRAIAPALVTAMTDAIERHIEVDDWQLCSACRLEHVLEEAGVTCD